MRIRRSTMTLRRPQGEDGVALVVAIALMGLVSTLMLTILAYALSETRMSGKDRQRSSAVAAAEGELDLTLAQIQNSAPELLPCGPQTQATSQQSPADQVAVGVEVTYYDAAGAPVPCGTLDITRVAQAKVVASGTSNRLAGAAPAERTVETLVKLTPTFQQGLQQAIFGQVGVRLRGNGEVFGQGGRPDANIYTNGDFLCARGSNQVYHGSVYAQGGATLSGSCVVDVDLHTRTGVVSDGPKTAVGGRVLVSGGNVALAAGHAVGRQVRASGTITPAWCTANPGKCVSGVAVPPPPGYSFPQLRWDSVAQAEWAAAGYTNVVVKNNCAVDSSGNNEATRWLLSNAASASRGKTALVTQCAIAMSRDAGVIALSDDLAIFASGGFSLERSMTFRSTSTAQRRLYFIQPYNTVTMPCTTGITLDNRVTIEGTVDYLIYTPCNVNKANNSDTYGQIYAGGTATVDNRLTMFYKPLPVFGLVPMTDIVRYYELDTLYKREVLN